jgi:RimJ/RimL family protein N-acetyltransferase
MPKLSEEQYQKILPLYLREGAEFPLIRAVIDMRQDGFIYADSEVKPSSCMVFTKFGFAYMFGDAGNKEFNLDISKLLFKESSLDNKYILWYNPPPDWRAKLNTFPQEKIRKRERIRFRFDISRYRKFFDERKRLPAGFIVNKIDSKLVQKMAAFNLDFPIRFWHSSDDFLANGFGFCAQKDEQIASICYTACVAGGLAEVDIATLEEYKSLGIGTATAEEFIRYCVENAIEPTWDCFSYNEPSKRIADTLGFSIKLIYPFYSFDRPFNDLKMPQDFYGW